MLDFLFRQIEYRKQKLAIICCFRVIHENVFFLLISVTYVFVKIIKNSSVSFLALFLSEVDNSKCQNNTIRDFFLT